MNEIARLRSRYHALAMWSAIRSPEQVAEIMHMPIERVRLLQANDLFRELRSHYHVEILKGGMMRNAHWRRKEGYRR